MTAYVPDPALLRATADVIRTNGWFQNGFFRPLPTKPPAQCPVCVLGALDVAAGCVPGSYTHTAYMVETWATGVLDEIRGSTGLDAWNDEPGRTVDEVLALLERAAVEAESARAAAGGETRG